MDTTLYIGMSAQSALQRKMDVIAHNVANMNTAAYKKEEVVFRQHLVDIEGADAVKDGKISFILDHGIVRNVERGQFTATGNPLDLFLDGDGYLAVEGSLGQGSEPHYTRAGRLQMDRDNFLTLLSGEKILDNDLDPIQFEDDDIDIKISEDGTVSAGDREVAKLGLFRFESEQEMNRLGNSLYETEQTAIPIGGEDDLQIKSLGYEGSNVNSVKMMVEMMEVMRSYQSAARNQDTYQKLREDSLDRLARVQ